MVDGSLTKEWNNLCYPISEKIHGEVISLPISPVQKIQQADFVIEAINNFNI